MAGGADIGSGWSRGGSFLVLGAGLELGRRGAKQAAW